MSETFEHKTVLKDQAVSMLNIAPGMTVIDCTAGGGGHTHEMLKALDNRGKVLAFDQDPEAYLHLQKKFAANITDKSLHLINENFSEIANVCDRMNIGAADAILADIGVSSPQLDHAERGFSFLTDGPLDMRMNPESGDASAADIVNTVEAKELTRILLQLGEEPKARFIAQAIVTARATEKITRTRQLADIVQGAVHYPTRSKKHPATKTFQALRIYVNRELDVLKQLIDDGFSRLKPGGRLAIITFHSLEDRIVKQAFKKLAQNQHDAAKLKDLPITEAQLESGVVAKIIKPFPQIPHADELAQNPRARSAKLRVVEKTSQL